MSDYNSDEEKTCPTCGETFSSEHGMKVHHVEIHGESIAGKIVECSWCGTEKRTPRHRAESLDNHFCDKECEGKWLSENRSGPDSPQWRGGMATVECAACGSEKEIFQANVSTYDRHYCGIGCMADDYETRLAGENGPNWTGGHLSYYGASWYPQRRRALERDGYQCVICGKGKDEMGRNPDVHHIVGIKKFENKAAANFLGNLVSLCRSHHHMVEKGTLECPLPQSPMTPQTVEDD